MEWIKDIIAPLMSSKEMLNLKEKVSKRRNEVNVLPKAEDVFNAFKMCPYDKLKVLILGQDPYPDKHSAHGLAFSSLSKDTPDSLKNIFKEIYTHNEPSIPIEDYFKTNDLTCWAKQGVLLLNSCLTVDESVPGSHKDYGWSWFTEKIINVCNEHNNKIVFLLWGAHAKMYKKLITDAKHLVLESVHPSPLSADKGFFGCDHFNKANRFLNGNDKESVKVDLRPFFDQEKASEYVKSLGEDTDKVINFVKEEVNFNLQLNLSTNIIDWRTY